MPSPRCARGAVTGWSHKMAPRREHRPARRAGGRRQGARSSPFPPPHLPTAARCRPCGRAADAGGPETAHVGPGMGSRADGGNEREEEEDEEEVEEEEEGAEGPPAQCLFCARCPPSPSVPSGSVAAVGCRRLTAVCPQGVRRRRGGVRALQRPARLRPPRGGPAAR